MIKHVLACGLLLGCANFARATSTIELDAGILRTAGGTNPVPVGGLLQIIASTGGASGTFGAPTAGSFVSGDNIVVASFAMNHAFAVGETNNIFTLTLTTTSSGPSAVTFDQGDALLLRWYPTLTFNASTNYNTTGPGLNTTYGQYRSNTGEGTSSLAWFAPADNSSPRYPNGLNFLTNTTVDINNNPGTNAPQAGWANFAVVPEPSTVFMLSLATCGLVGSQLRRRSKAR